jgi:recyclin-1
MFRKKKEASNLTPKSLITLPPDLIIKILQYLPVTDLPSVALASRRLKVLSAADDVYIPKLKALAIYASFNQESSENADVLNSKLKQLPGGHLFTASARYFEQGSLWGPTMNSIPSKEALDKVVELAITDHNVLSEPPIVNEAPIVETKISSILPNPKIIIGAGGLKGLKKKSIENKLTVGRSRNPSNNIQTQKSAKELFKDIYIKLYAYFKDFRVDKRGDAKVFQDHQNIIEIGAILSKLRLFGKAKFIPKCDDLNFALETAIEFFESTILGDFEKAYDKNDIVEMRNNALASFELNGGLNAVNVFIAKNPIFFDHTFNPSLVASKLPTVGGPAVGYALADEFASFMDHMLNNCKRQAELVSQVFVPNVDALTNFVNRVFEDSISEYLSAVLLAAKGREGLGIYLHTLATSVYCCTQFLDYIANNPYNVKVNITKLRSSIQSIFAAHTDDYMAKELKHLENRIDKELKKFASVVLFLFSK